MIKLKLILIVLGLTGLLTSCVDPEDPSEVQILTGEWEVQNVIANGQLDFPDDVFMEESILYLNRNETYLFINVDGSASSGTWSADEDNLSLTGENGDSRQYEIIYMDYSKLQVSYTVTNPATGEINLTYVFNRIEE